MHHEFEVRVDTTMMRAAWNAWFFKRNWMWPLAAAAGLVLGSVYLDSRSNGLGPISIVGLTVLGLTALISGMTYFAGLRQSVSKLTMMGDGRVSYRLTDEAINGQSALGSVSLAWSAIAELRRYKDLVLVGFRGAMYSVIPASQIPEAALAFMIERCRAAGAQITDL